jgi:hypothetical protein
MNTELAEIPSITNGHLVPFPQYKKSKLSIIAHESEESSLGLMLVFTIFPKTETISIEVIHDVSVSTGIWNNSSLDISKSSSKILEQSVKTTLYGIIDEFGGALHININTALVKGTQQDLLDVVLNMFNGESQRKWKEEHPDG